MKYPDGDAADLPFLALKIRKDTNPQNTERERERNIFLLPRNSSSLQDAGFQNMKCRRFCVSVPCHEIPVEMCVRVIIHQIRNNSHLGGNNISSRFDTAAFFMVIVQTDVSSIIIGVSDFSSYVFFLI